MHVQARGVGVAAVRERAALIEMIGLVDVEVGIQILEVVGIADIGVVHLGEPARIQAGTVLPAVHPALVLVLGLQFAVVVAVIQVCGAELALAAARQVAKFAFHQQAAIGHQVRIQRGVEVRCQVDVVGRLYRKAVVAGRTDARCEEARLATVIDWEVDIRCVEHRNILDPQRDVGCRTEAGGRVQRDVVAFQVPGIFARFAAGVGAILEADDRGLFALGVLRAAADLAGVHDIFGVLHLGFAAVEEDLGAIADQQCIAVAEADVAGQLAAVLQLVQAGFIRLDLDAALAQNHIASEGGDFLLLLVACGLGRHVGRRFAHRRGVEFAGTVRLDIGACAVRAGFGELSGCQLIAGHPVQMAVVGTA